MPHLDDNNPLFNSGGKGPHWAKVFSITICAVLGIVLAVSGAIYYYGHNIISRANFLADEDVLQVETLPEEAFDNETEEDGSANGIVLNESELEYLHSLMGQVESIDTVMDESVYNVLLVGVDRSDKTWNGNSDCMILVSLNNDKDRISVISLMRDTYVDIPGHGYNKLNASYAYGGGPLLCDTVEENYRIDVERYAAVDFEDLVDIIDAMGGIELTWTDAEIEVANGYIIDMCQNVLGIDNYWEHILFDGAGTYLCDGIQAVAYARNRFVGNSDYTRTQRQRYVLQQMAARIKTLSSTKFVSFVTKVIPLVTHNIPESEIWNLVGDAPSLLKYDVVTDRVPYDGMYETVDIDGQGMLVPDWQETIAQMHRTIYGDGSVSNNSDNDPDTETEAELTDEYMDITGGTGTLFPNGLSGQ